MIIAAVAGASGYAGGEIVRLLLGHPQIELGVVTADSQAGKRLGDVQPHLAAWGTGSSNPHGGDAARPRRGLPRAAARRVGELAAQLPDDIVVVDCGADYRLDRRRASGRRSTARRTPGPGPTACPSCRAAAAPSGTSSRARTRIAVPGCYPTASLLGLAPGFAAGVLEPTTSSSCGQRHSGAGKALKPHLLGAEVHGRDVAVRGGRRPPAYPRDRAEPRARRGRAGLAVSFTPTLAPMARGILATAPRRCGPATTPEQLRDAWRGRLRRRAVRAPAARGPVARTSDDLGANTAHLQLARRRVGRPGRLVAAIDNLIKGTAGGAIQSTNLALGLPRDRRPPDRRSRPVSDTSRSGLPGRRRHRRPQGERQAGPRPRRQRRPRPPAAAVFTSNRVVAAPVVWSRQVVADGALDAVVLNSGGANACTGPRGSRTRTHRRGGGGHARSSAVDVAGLLHRADRRAAPDGQDQRRHHDRGRARSRPTATTAAAERDHDHRHPRQDRARSRATAGRSGGWPRAPACSRPRSRRCSSSSSPTRVTDAGTARRGPPRGDVHTFDRVDSDGCQSTNDTVLLMASGASA